MTLSREHRDEAEYREALAIVGAQSRRLGRLVEDMLVLARADAGGYPLRPVDLYLDEVVAECRRAVERAGDRARRHDRSGARRPEMPFRGDEDLLRRLLLNLLQNAVQHTPPGGVGRSIVHVRTVARRRSAIATRAPAFRIADRARIFDRFVQLDPARRGHGAGLGLPIARWIAEAHGGSLEPRIERSRRQHILHFPAARIRRSPRFQPSLIFCVGLFRIGSQTGDQKGRSLFPEPARTTR